MIWHTFNVYITLRTGTNKSNGSLARCHSFIDCSPPNGWFSATLEKKKSQITQAKKELMQARKDMLPCAWRGVGTSGPNLGLAWTSCPLPDVREISKLELSRFETFPSSIQPQKSQITQAKKKLIQARKNMLPCAWKGVGTSGTSLGLAWTSCPVPKFGRPRNLKIRAIQMRDFP